MEHVDRERFTTGDRFSIFKFVGLWECVEPGPVTTQVINQPTTKNVLEWYIGNIKQYQNRKSETKYADTTSRKKWVCCLQDWRKLNFQKVDVRTHVRLMVVDSIVT